MNLSLSKAFFLIASVAYLITCAQFLRAGETYVGYTDNASFAAAYNLPGQWIYTDLKAVAAVKFLSDPAPSQYDAIPTVLTLDSAENRIEWSFYDTNAKAYGYTGFSDGFNSPGGIAAASNGDVFVSDTFNQRIVKLNYNANSMTFVSSIGSQGTAEGQFNAPMEIAMDTNENIYIADLGNSRIQKINSNGVPVDSFASNDGFSARHMADYCSGYNNMS